jgi:hypothetical protein
VTGWASAARLRIESAVVHRTLAELPERGPEARALVDASARSAAGWLGRFADWLYGERGMEDGISSSRSRV